MASAQRRHRTPRWTPTATGRREAEAAWRELYGNTPAPRPDEAVQLRNALAAAPYRKRQGDLALELPEPEPR